MTIARSEIVDESISCIYHCVSRCVRRSFLCGVDLYTGRNYDHRKEWIEDRLKRISQIFVIDLLEYALMSNHQHLMIRTKPQILEKLTDFEIAVRWRRLYPKQFETIEEYYNDIHMLTSNKDYIDKLRSRLGSVSWFMKSLNEYIARKANKEDEVTGSFWEGRFKCQMVKGDQAILACSLYVNLNPIRAKVFKTPEESKYTSAYLRIKRYQSLSEEDEKLSWLSPIDIDNGGYLPITTSEYLKILDDLGRKIAYGKQGSISQKLDPILKRLKVEPKTLNSLGSCFSSNFSILIASAEDIKSYAALKSKKWLKGIRKAEKVFAHT